MKWQSVQCLSTLILSIVLITIFGKEEISDFSQFIVYALFALVCLIMILTYCSVSESKVLEEKNKEKETELNNEYKLKFKAYEENAKSREKNDEFVRQNEELAKLKKELKIRENQLQTFYYFFIGQWASKDQKCPFGENDYKEIKQKYDNFIETLNSCGGNETIDNNN